MSAYAAVGLWCPLPFTCCYIWHSLAVQVATTLPMHWMIWVGRGMNSTTPLLLQSPSRQSVHVKPMSSSIGTVYYLRQGGYVIVAVCLLATLCKHLQTDLHEIFREGWQSVMNKWLNFGGNPDHRLDTGIVFRIHHYWEIWKVVNGHKSAAHTDLPDGSTGKTCLGGGMHCSISSSFIILLANVNSRSRSLYAVARPSVVCLSVCRLSVCLSSVCLSSVTLVHPTQAVQLFGNISTAFGTLAIH